MRVHVTGASGFLGRELLRQAPEASGERVEVRDADAVQEAFARLRPDVVVHTAYRQDGPDAWETTVDGAANVARGAREVGARLIHLSTDVVFDGRKGSPYVEYDEPCPVTEYGQAKADAEERVRAAHPDALLVRTSLIVGGPGHEPSRHELAALAPELTFYEDEIRCPIFVSDLASALLELVEFAELRGVTRRGLDVSGVLHVAGADALSRADLAEVVAGRPVRRAPAPPDRPRDCRLDCSRARALLRTELRGITSVMRAAAGRVAG